MSVLSLGSLDSSSHSALKVSRDQSLIILSVWYTFEDEVDLLEVDVINSQTFGIQYDSRVLTLKLTLNLISC